MIVILRFRVPAGQWEAFRPGLDSLLDHLRGSAGLERLETGRNVDDDALIAVITRWTGPKAWRSAFGGAGRMVFMAVARWMLDEPNGYLDLDADQRNLPRGGGEPAGGR